MTVAKRPAATWFDDLPVSRLLVEMSLWSADLAHLEADTLRVEQGTDIFHIDVADGLFSPSLLFFPDLVARLRRVTGKPFHVHLMVSDAIVMEQIEQFAEAGADLISVHVENSSAGVALAKIAALGLKTGIVLKVETPVAAAADFMSRVDMLTLLGTRIGVKGQSLAIEAPERITQARELARQISGRRVIVAADGGIRETTVPLLRAAGAETVVMGSLAFGAPDFKGRIEWARALGGPAG